MGDVFTPGPPRVPQTGRPFGSNGMAGAAPALIRFAYYVFGGDFDLRIDAPAWIKTARFDVEGTTKGSGEVSQVRSMAMLRHLLAERFALRVHCEAQVAQYD